MLSKSDKLWLKSFFATKDDLKSFATKEDINDVARKDDLKSFATKEDIKPLAKQSDLLNIKEKLDNLTEFSQEAISNIFAWTDEIHKSIVKENLPKRVKKLEQILKTS